jgi:hypothetical protein
MRGFVKSPAFFAVSPVVFLFIIKDLYYLRNYKAIKEWSG